jgi:hypothetical protein
MFIQFKLKSIYVTFIALTMEAVRCSEPLANTRLHGATSQKTAIFRCVLSTTLRGWVSFRCAGIMIDFTVRNVSLRVRMDHEHETGLQRGNTSVSSISPTTRYYLIQYSVWLRTGRPGDRGSIPGRGKRIFPLVSVSRLAHPASCPIGTRSTGKGVTLTTNPHLLPGSRMRSCKSPKRLHCT